MGEDKVTIDSIQIEIESSSTNAAKGIDALAGSLEKLKKHGSFKTVSNNLNNLSVALKNLPNVHSASNALRTLANSIEKLKGVGSVASLSNSLAKLPKALNSVANINLDKIGPQLEKVAETVAPLSNIKAGGLNTMVNSLKKLGEVTKSLDDETIEQFAKKVELLNDKLAPLSAKMATIKTGFNAINTSARKASQSVEDFGEGINASALNMTSFIEIAQTVISALTTIVQKITEYIHQAAQWDGVKYQFGNAFGEQADIYYEKISKITEALNINKQAFMENSAMATSMLIGFGVDKKDAREMGLGYTQLAYDIWAAYNNVYETLDGADGAMAAVRSAIAGEVEPIRRAGFTIVEATLAQTAANHGLDISLQNATEAQKSYLRYLELVDQAQRKGVVGTYAREMETAEGMMRTFSQQLKSLAQAFGSLFIPILVKVMPYVQAFVELLKEGVFWLASIFGIEIQDIGDTWNDFSSGAGALDDVTGSAGNATGALEDATKAAKELKNATLGIDELNVISPPTSASGADGGGAGGAGGNGFAGLDVDSLWDDAIFDGIQQDVDRIKEKLKGWMPVIASVAAALAGLRLVQLLDDIGLIEKSKLFSGDLFNFKKWGEFFDTFKNGGIIAGLTAMFPLLGKIAGVFSKFFGDFGAFIALVKEGGLVAALEAAFPKIASFIAKILPKMHWIIAIIIAVIAAITFLIKNWEKMKEVVVNFFDENIAPKIEEIKKHFEKMKEVLEPLTPVFEAIGVAIKWVSDAFDWLLEAIGGVVVSLIGGALAGAFNSIMSVVEGVVQYISGVIQYFRGVIDLIVGIFTGDGKKINEAWDLICAGITDAALGLYDMTIGAVVELVKGIINWFKEMWDVLVGHSIVPDTVNAIIEWFKSLPSKLGNAVADFVSGIIDDFKDLGSGITEKFSSAWESVKTWWSKKPSLTSYTPTIGDIKSKLSSAWTTAKDWWTKNKTALSTYTPSIGKIWEKLKSAWTSAKDWWNKSRSSLSYTPSIGSISSKLSSAWTSAKNWWNKSRSSLSYTPSIGSIKDKIVSAWNSAKKWWSSNAKLSTKLNISVPKLTVNWGEVSALGKTFKYPKSFSVKFAADGGMFDAGSLIWAGERGAEIVANAAGGKTGVMNVQQMQDAVYEGVYAAMSAVMRGNDGGSGSQVIKVYLDGKEITSTVEKTQRERGAPIMGNEVYSY